jgi:hypothetical protein
MTGKDGGPIETKQTVDDTEIQKRLELLGYQKK